MKIKEAVAIGTIAVAAPLALSNENTPSGTSDASHEITADTSMMPENPSRLVADSALDTKIGYVETTAPTIAAADPSVAAAESIDTLKAKIEEVMASKPKAAEVKESKPASLEANMTMTVKGLEDAFRVLIKDTLAKKERGTELASLNIDQEGDHLKFKALMKAPTEVAVFDIHVSGKIEQLGNELKVTDSKIDATWVVRSSAKKRISPLLEKLCDDVKNSLAAKYDRKIKSMVITDKGIVIEFE